MLRARNYRARRLIYLYTLAPVNFAFELKIHPRIDRARSAGVSLARIRSTFVNIDGSSKGRRGGGGNCAKKMADCTSVGPEPHAFSHNGDRVAHRMPRYFWGPRFQRLFTIFPRTYYRERRV